jgi:Domain of unknown function (DUF4407)
MLAPASHGPGPVLPRPAGPFTKFILKITGVDEETLRQCPPQDWDNVRAIGEIMICTWLYQCALFYIIGDRLFAEAGQIRPDVALAAMFIATFIMAIDSYMIMRSGWHLSGIEELKRGGLDVAGGTLARAKAAVFLAIRIALSIGLAQLTAIFVALLIFGADIDARLLDKYREANAPLIATATTLVDGAIGRATAAAAAQSDHVASLTAQATTVRQNEIESPQVQEAQREVARLIEENAKAEQDVKTAETFATNEMAGIKGANSNSGTAGRGPRYRAAMDQLAGAQTRAQKAARELNAARERLDNVRANTPANDTSRQRSHDQLIELEQTLAAEKAQLAVLKDDLAKLTSGREAAIRRSIEEAPGHVALEKGFLQQLIVLGQIADESRRIALVILLIDLVSFGFELAAVLAKVTSYVPTTYAVLLARDAYMRAVRVVDDMVAELKTRETDLPISPDIIPPGHPLDIGETIDVTPAAAPDAGTINPEPQPVRRKRGRPRKNPLN